MFVSAPQMSHVSSSISIFKDMADAISAKYLANIRLMAVEQGTRPPFDDLMSQLKLMEQELTGQGVKFLEKSQGTQAERDTITDELKIVIRSTIENFIRQL